MVRKITEPNFNRFGFDNDGNLRLNPSLDDNIGQAVVRLIAWDYVNQHWDLVALDSDGRLLVSTSPTKASESNSSNPTVTTSASNILVSNSDRKQAIIQNSGLVDCYLGFGEDATVANGFYLEAGATYISDVWLGRISAITSSGSTTLSVQEMS